MTGKTWDGTNYPGICAGERAAAIISVREPALIDGWKDACGTMVMIAPMER